jgi:AmiR/NasT family two-component response regulator
MRNNDVVEQRVAAALRTRPIIDQAKGVLVAARCESPEAAFAELKYVAELHGFRVNVLAAGLVDVAAGRDVRDETLGCVIRQEWGHLLSC